MESPQTPAADARDAPQLTRRQVVGVAGAAAATYVAGSVVLGAAPATAAGTWTRAQHDALPIAWNHPFTQRAETRLGVDGYPEPSYPGHRGVDYYVTPRAGTPACAVASGVVTGGGYEPSGRGQFVTINHGSGVFGDYCHFIQGSTSVSIGQNVSGGTVVGLTGFTGYLDPPERENSHLHLRLYLSDGTNLNPIWLVTNAPLAGDSPTGPPQNPGEDELMYKLITFAENQQVWIVGISGKRKYIPNTYHLSLLQRFLKGDSLLGAELDIIAGYQAAVAP